MNARTHARLPFFLIGVLTLLLAGCTVTYVVPENGVVIRPEPGPVVIERFDVFGGTSIFREGDEIAFAIRTRQSGYVTLSVLLPDGHVRVVASDIPVRGGQTTLLDGSSFGSSFLVGPPSGYHRVRAAFTSGPTGSGTAVFEGRSGEAGWTTAIRIVIDPFPVTDVAATEFYVR